MNCDDHVGLEEETDSSILMPSPATLAGNFGPTRVDQQENNGGEGTTASTATGRGGRRDHQGGGHRVATSPTVHIRAVISFHHYAAAIIHEGSSSYRLTTSVSMIHLAPACYRRQSKNSSSVALLRRASFQFRLLDGHQCNGETYTLYSIREREREISNEN